jgi:hypothetical protein
MPYCKNNPLTVRLALNNDKQLPIILIKIPLK